MARRGPAALPGAAAAATAPYPRLLPAQPRHPEGPSASTSRVTGGTLHRRHHHPIRVPLCEPYPDLEAQYSTDAGIFVLRRSTASSGEGSGHSERE